MDRVNEIDTKHAPYIPESATDTLYNSIVRIEKKNLIGTGFFMKIITIFYHIIFPMSY